MLYIVTFIFIINNINFVAKYGGEKIIDSLPSNKNGTCTNTQFNNCCGIHALENTFILEEIKNNFSEQITNDKIIEKFKEYLIKINENNRKTKPEILLEQRKILLLAEIVSICESDEIKKQEQINKLKELFKEKCVLYQAVKNEIVSDKFNKEYSNKFIGNNNKVKLSLLSNSNSIIARNINVNSVVQEINGNKHFSIVGSLKANIPISLQSIQLLLNNKGGNTKEKVDTLLFTKDENFTIQYSDDIQIIKDNEHYVAKYEKNGVKFILDPFINNKNNDEKIYIGNNSNNNSIDVLGCAFILEDAVKSLDDKKITTENIKDKILKIIITNKEEYKKIKNDISKQKQVLFEAEKNSLIGIDNSFLLEKFKNECKNYQYVKNKIESAKISSPTIFSGTPAQMVNNILNSKQEEIDSTPATTSVDFLNSEQEEIEESKSIVDDNTKTVREQNSKINKKIMKIVFKNYMTEYSNLPEDVKSKITNEKFEIIVNYFNIFKLKIDELVNKNNKKEIAKLLNSEDFNKLSDFRITRSIINKIIAKKLSLKNKIDKNDSQDINKTNENILKNISIFDFYGKKTNKNDDIKFILKNNENNDYELLGFSVKNEDIISTNEENTDVLYVDLYGNILDDRDKTKNTNNIIVNEDNKLKKIKFENAFGENCKFYKGNQEVNEILSLTKKSEFYIVTDENYKIKGIVRKNNILNKKGYKNTGKYIFKNNLDSFTIESFDNIKNFVLKRIENYKKLEQDTTKIKYLDILSEFVKNKTNEKDSIKLIEINNELLKNNNSFEIKVDDKTTDFKILKQVEKDEVYDKLEIKSLKENVDKYIKSKENLEQLLNNLDSFKKNKLKSDEKTLKNIRSKLAKDIITNSNCYDNDGIVSDDFTNMIISDNEIIKEFNKKVVKTIKVTDKNGNEKTREGYGVAANILNNDSFFNFDKDGKVEDDSYTLYTSFKFKFNSVYKKSKKQINNLGMCFNFKSIFENYKKPNDINTKSLKTKIIETIFIVVKDKGINDVKSLNEIIYKNISNILDIKLEMDKKENIISFVEVNKKNIYSIKDQDSIKNMLNNSFINSVNQKSSITSKEMSFTM